MSVEAPNKTPWRIAGKSDVGVVRQVNEDAFLCDLDRGGYIAIADGVGGLEYGERASRAAVEGLKQILDAECVPTKTRPNFQGIFEKLDSEIESIGEELVPGFGIATTLDVAVDGGNGLVHFAHIGDSGILILHDGELVRLSEEHTLAQEELTHGNRDFPSVYSNTLTRALGVGLPPEPQVFSFATTPGDRILLATDGITRTLSHEKIKEILSDPSATPESAASALISAANEAGGFDNSTAVVAFL